MGIFGLLFIILPLIILFIIISFGINLLHSILRFFGFGRSNNNQTSSWNNRQQTQSHRSQPHSTNSSSKNKKIIEENEGEYVDFEVIE
ncbi:MAG: DUF4834 family protein [Bacteroidaceae bacterium]|nr:DUF4834 family protein [Bacteroidaceae bacterium]